MILNETKYHFADFTLSEYENLIDLAKKNYTFVGYREFDHSKRHILWRHDIDMSPAMALETARIENKKGVKATYYVLLHSDFYNLLDVQNRNYIKEILSLGHEIGLHLDTFFYNVSSEDQLDNLIRFEKTILEKVFEVSITSFSFHNNTPFTLACDKDAYGGLINTYSRKIKSIPYCSDSNGYWRFKRLKDVLNEAGDHNLHVLTHEVWWTREIMSPREKILKCISNQSEAVYLNYENALERLNLLNIDWE